MWTAYVDGRVTPPGEYLGRDWGIASPTCPFGDDVPVTLLPSDRRTYGQTEMTEMLEDTHELLMEIQTLYPDLVAQYVCIMGSTVSGYWLMGQPSARELVEVALLTNRETHDVYATIADHQVMLRELRDATVRRLALSKEE